jgi:lysyl-tRNA synthetase class 2
MGLEWYETLADYTQVMKTTEALLQYVAQTVLGSSVVGGVDLGGTWPRVTVREAFQRWASIDLEACPDLDSLRAAARAQGIHCADDDEYDDVFFRVFLDRIEPSLGESRPHFLTEYPVSMAVMARACPRNPRWAERVELFVGGQELANGFSELTDPNEQQRRFEADRKVMGVTDEPLDQGFLQALRHGMPPCTGMALGLDRLILWMRGGAHLDEVVPFPYSRL